MGDAALRVGQPSAVALECGRSHVPQVGDGAVARRLAQGGRGRETALTELSVLAIHELVRRVRVGEDEHGALERHVIVVEVAAVEEQQGTAPPHAGAELVQDAAAHAHEVVLGRLGRLDQGDGVQLADSLGEEPREELRRGHLHGGRAGHAGTGRHVRGDERVEAANLHAELGDLIHNPNDIVGPGLLAGLLRGAVDAELHHDAFERVRRQSAGSAIVGRTGRDDVPVDGRREDVALVVVRVVAEDFCTAGGYPEGSGLCAEGGREAVDGGLPQGCGCTPALAGKALEAA
mmetsp:Transcript_71159/g.189206  ORF Transcript_71159/g.189206 Transcript_71159/m.189206 type:complete len:290 (+) Transcript_71159:509-1378(+)